MALSPTFWVAVSFIIFIILSWRFIKSSFLKIINNYRNSISSSLNDLYSRKEESTHILDQSNKELEDSNLNGFVLNSHKIAKEILEKSEEVVRRIKDSTSKDVEYSLHSTQSLLDAKTLVHVSDISSDLIKKYLQNNQEKFGQIAANKILDTLTKQTKSL